MRYTKAQSRRANPVKNHLNSGDRLIKDVLETAFHLQIEPMFSTKNKSNAEKLRYGYLHGYSKLGATNKLAPREHQVPT